MDSATWCRTPAAASAARRLRPEVSKNSSTALSSNEGELARSITTCVPAMACLSPSPVMVLTPVFGEAATTSWPRWRRMATVFEPISPVPPITTIFMFSSERESVSRREARVCAGSFASGGGCTPLRSGLSPFDEGQQVRVHDLSVRRAHAVRELLIDLQRAVLEQLGRERRAISDRYELVLVAVHHECGDGDDLQVLREIGLREGLYAIVLRLRPAPH